MENSDIFYDVYDLGIMWFTSTLTFNTDPLI